MAILLSTFASTLTSTLNVVASAERENMPPKSKKKLTLGDIGNSSHFQFVSKKDAEASQQRYVLPNTEKSTK